MLVILKTNIEALILKLWEFPQPSEYDSPGYVIPLTSPPSKTGNP